MRVISKVQCGFKRDGSILLRRGVNTLDEPLSAGERAFVDAMVTAKIVEIVDEQMPQAPASETHFRAAAPAPQPALARANAEAAAGKPPLRRRSAR